MKKLFLSIILTSILISSKLFACSCVFPAPSFCEILTESSLAQEIVITDKNDTIAFAKVLHTLVGTYSSETIKLRIYPKIYSYYIDPSTGERVEYEDRNSCGYSEEAHSDYTVGDTILASIESTSMEGIYKIFHNICATYFQYKNGGVYTSLEDCPVSAVLSNENDIVLEQLTIFPNPSSGTIYLNKSGSFSIFSSTGEKLISFENSKELNLSDFKSGMYILKKEDDISPETIKFVLE